MGRVMRFARRRFGGPLFLASTVGCSGLTPVEPPRQPNVLLIVADDLGYSDIGAFGSEIATPHLDALARNGRVLTNFHTSPNCSPTRAMLMSGADNHQTGLGSMAETTRTLVSHGIAPFGPQHRYGWDTLPDGYEGYLNDRAFALPEIFRAGGYHTYMAGKWHLATRAAPQADQFRPASLPHARGFERSFALAEGGAPHFAPVPGHATTADVNATYLEDGQRVSLPANFYSSNGYTDKLISFIETNRQDRRPFFAYAAYTAPHFPLQAPDEDLQRQRGRYDEGYDVIRQRRLARQVSLGVIPSDFQAIKTPQGQNARPWVSLSARERAVEARKMEVYAAMVENLDRNIGRLVEYLQAHGLYENTMIVFMSDNGAHAAPRSSFADDSETDNSFENMGRPRSNITYGSAWAEVSTAPFRLWKRYSAEGGISAPMIVRLPGQSRADVPVTALTHVTDVFPTLLDVAGLPVPERTASGAVPVALAGTSLRPLLGPDTDGRQDAPHGRPLVGELFGGRYVNDGRWKLLSLQPPLGQDRWMLFDMARDRGETQDLSAVHPEEVARLRQLFEAYAQRVGVIALPKGTRIPAAFD